MVTAARNKWHKSSDPIKRIEHELYKQLPLAVELEERKNANCLISERPRE